MNRQTRRSASSPIEEALAEPLPKIVLVKVVAQSIFQSHRGTKTATSLTLLERVRAKDEESWRRLVELYQPLVAYWCHRWSINPADVDDVIQDVFAVVSEKVQTFRRERPADSFRGWLRGITRNKLCEYSRTNAHRISATSGSNALYRLENLPAKEANKLLDEPPQRISELYLRAILLVKEEFTLRTWSVFWRIAVDGLAAADVAREVGVTPAAARMAKSRVLRRLREELGDLG